MVAKLQADEISSIIKERIDNFELDLNISETGKVIAYADGVAKVYGLKNAMSYEMVEFETGDKGLESIFEEGCVGVVVLGAGKEI